MKPSNLVACSNRHIQYLCERMRPDEIEQYVALTGKEVYNPDVVALGFMATPGMKFTVLNAEGFPAASGGYEQIIPGVFQSWMVGCHEGWETNWRSLTKAIRWLQGQMFESGARRLETTVLASRTKAIEWYERALGLKREGDMVNYGKNGETAARFALVKGGCHGQ